MFTKFKRKLSVNKSRKFNMPNGPTICSNNKVLICDDSIGNRIILRNYFNKLRIEVDEADDGEIALQKVVQNGEYQLIWMDVRMPYIDGITCVNELRNNMDYKGPIIGLSGYINEISIEKCLQVGMNEIIQKPIDKYTLQKYCNKYIGKN